MLDHLRIIKGISKKVTMLKWVKDKDILYHKRENSYGTTTNALQLEGHDSYTSEASPMTKLITWIVISIVLLQF